MSERFFLLKCSLLRIRASLGHWIFVSETAIKKAKTNGDLIFVLEYLKFKVFPFFIVKNGKF